MCVGGVLLQGLGIDENVIKVHYDELVQQISKHIIDECLEDSRGNDEAKWRHKILKVAQWCVKKPSSTHLPL